jgi:hypothetical protein
MMVSGESAHGGTVEASKVIEREARSGQCFAKAQRPTGDMLKGQCRSVPVVELSDLTFGQAQVMSAAVLSSMSNPTGGWRKS